MSAALALEAGVFTGYASLFGETDMGGDVVAPGAFRASLKKRGAHGVRMLFQHDPAQPIGTWLDIAEDGKGLRVVGKLNLDVARARELAALIRDGALDGLSIGYKTIRSARAPGGARKLLALDLWEISLVTFPMLPGARVGAKRARESRMFSSFQRREWLSTASAIILALGAENPDLDRRYRADQPRDETGKWAFDGGRRRRSSSGRTHSESISEGLTIASAFSPEERELTVEIFRAAFCKGGTKGVWYNDFNNWTIADLERRAQTGDAKARTCIKLLSRPEYRK
jgi:hypothetical protein